MVCWYRLLGGDNRNFCAAPFQFVSNKMVVEQQVLINYMPINAKTTARVVLTFMAHTSGFEPETSASGARKS